MKSCCKRAIAAAAGFVLTFAAVAAAVRVWQRERVVRGDRSLGPTVPDTVLADRIRSELGLLERQLDIPHVHVMVERDVAVLHGDVPTDAAAHVIESRVREVSGVRHVVSHLHVGLLASDTRPSSGRSDHSPAAQRIVAAALRGGGGEVTAELAAKAVLTVFGASLPAHTRTRIASHLPLDVGAWLLPSGAMRRVDTVEDLYEAVSERDVFPAAHTPWVVAAVLRELRAIIADDVTEVAFELPAPLRHLWLDAAPAA